MTHVVRDLDRPGSKMHKKEVVEAVSVMEAPPMIVVGLVGFSKTPHGLRCLRKVWAQHIPDQMKRTFYKNWARSKKNAFKKYSARLAESTRHFDRNIEDLKKYSSVVRVIAIAQPRLIKSMQRKKAHVMQIQINGGTIPEKVDFGLKLFESAIPISTVFQESEMVDTLAVTKGHGFNGVIKRFGVTKLPRKTHKGLRKVACIGAWHPARVSWTVPRAGQMGYHHRTEINKKIYKIGVSAAIDKGNARCEADLTDKVITPMGGFPHFGTVRNDYILLKGNVTGPRKRVFTLRKQLRSNPSRACQEQITLKFIDTSSKWGHGKFQTLLEKEKFMGPRKKSAFAK